MYNSDIITFRKIQESYRRILESAELDSVKKRLDSLTQKDVSEVMCISDENIVNGMLRNGMTRLLGKSSRAAFLTPDNTVLKIALTRSGIAQNSAEIMNAAEKNSYGCFAKMLWCSKNKLAVEMEYGEFMEGSDLDFENITGVNLDKYFDYLKYEKYVNITPKHRDAVYKFHFKWHVNDAEKDWLKINHDEVSEILYSADSNDEPKNVLKNLAKYIKTHNSPTDFSFRDVKQSNNWGIVERNGQKVCVIIDYGASDRVLNKYYLGIDTQLLKDEK